MINHAVCAHLSDFVCSASLLVKNELCLHSYAAEKKPAKKQAEDFAFMVECSSETTT